MSAPMPVSAGWCRSRARVNGRVVECQAGCHYGSHVALVDGEPVFWGPGLKAAS